MHELHELKEKLLRELEEYSTKEMSAGSLEVIDKLSHAVKNICKILEAAEEEEYSQRGSRNSYGRYAYEGDRYSREGSYARNARRDSMGRYSREGEYSRSADMDGLVEQIHSMMQELPQSVRQDAQRFVQKLEQTM